MIVAVTGSTGAVGWGVTRELESRGHEIVPVGRRCRHRWDLSEPIGASTREVFLTADAVVHCAADIRIGGPAGDLHATNVAAVAELVGVLRRSGYAGRYVHISSAFVERSDRVHHNAYERSKWQAELMVRAGGLAASIVRPSLVIGETTTGNVGRYSGIFMFLRMLRFGLVPALPGYPDTHVDLIPVDIVARKIVDEVTLPVLGAGTRVVGATSGENSPTLFELVNAAFEVFEEETGESLDRPKFVKPQVYHRLFRPVIVPELSPAQLVLLKTIEIFLPYFEQDHCFGSHPEISRDAVMSTWRSSVRGWLGTAGAGSSRGREVWAKRS